MDLLGQYPYKTGNSPREMNNHAFMSIGEILEKAVMSVSVSFRVIVVHKLPY